MMTLLSSYIILKFTKKKEKGKLSPAVQCVCLLGQSSLWTVNGPSLKPPYRRLKKKSAKMKAQHEYWRRRLPSFFSPNPTPNSGADCCFNSNSDPKTTEKERSAGQEQASPLSPLLRTQIRMTGSMDLPTKGGFSYDLCRRNEFLEKKGLKLPGYLKTGTTIVGLVFKDGVVLGADTRATEGPIVADKNCEKIHFMAPNIYCCGAGTAADTEAVTDMVSSQLQLHRYATGRESRVVTALTLLKSHLFKYQGHVSAALVLGGVDCTGPHLHTVYPHGSTDTLPFATMGSGSLAAMSVFESKYKEGLTREEGIQLVTAAIRAGIFNDLGSGSNVDVCVITKGKREYLRNHESPNPRTYVSSKGYSFTKGQTEVLSTKITPLKQRVEVVEGGDAMEE